MFAYRKKKSQYKKRDPPLSPGIRESVNLLPKYFRHQPKKGDGTIFFAKIIKKNEKRDPTNPIAVHLVNPFHANFCVLQILVGFPDNWSILLDNLAGSEWF